MKLRIMTVLLCLGLVTGTAQATTTTYSGFVNDQANAALVYSDLSPALFGNDNDIANNVALYQLFVPITGNVGFVSKGFAAGGVDPYFSLFQGSGPTATFLGSNYDQAFSTGGDFNLSYALAAGNYVVALGTSANMSFAENYGSGTFGDGFNSLGTPYSLGNYYYELAVTTPDQAVPEPSTLLLIGAGLASLAAFRKKLNPQKY
jgi:hypothetical protein